MRQKRHKIDVAIVGAGVAGLSAALAAADEGASVTVLAKASHTASNSYAAQGGVAAAVGEGDDPVLHAADTFAAGRGICRVSAVELLTAEAPARIAWLRELGVRFDEGLSLEGGHSRARVVHAGGADTGRHIADVLTLRAREHPRIRFEEGTRVESLSELSGAPVVLATGGFAALWSRTTNPRGATMEPDTSVNLNFMWGRSVRMKACDATGLRRQGTISPSRRMAPMNQFVPMKRTGGSIF